MPDTLTLPSAAEEEPALHVCVWDHVARTVAWLDAANGRGPHETALRAMKIAEEAGEAVAAYIGLTGANPRKGVTASPDDLVGELCDVVLAGLIALTTITGGTPQAESRLARHIAARAVRLRRLRAALVTVPAADTCAGRPATASAPMRPGEFADLAEEVAAVCERHGVRACSEDDQDRLGAALWRFIHPDLAHGPADPYHDPDD
jgi:hypothetical protein